MGAFVDLTGRVYGKWTVSHRVYERGSRTRWWCVCVCGKARAVNGNILVRGESTSCGCSKKRRDAKPGLLSRLRAVGECAEWTGSTNAGGYGACGIKFPEGNIYLAHRAAWRIANGPIPEGMFVLHSCDNPKCCKPSHLWLGTNDDNMKDMARKKRAGNIWTTGNVAAQEAMREHARALGKRPKSAETRAKMAAAKRADHAAGLYAHVYAKRRAAR